MMQRSDGPSWRLLGLLAVLVVAAHVLVLRAAPMRLGASFDRVADARSFSTRSIDARAEPEALPPPPPPPPPRKKVAPRPPKSPQPEEKVAAAPVDRAPPAPDSIAEPAPAPEPSVAAGTPTSADPGASPGAAAPGPAPAQVAGQTPPAGPVSTPVSAIALPPSVLLEYKMVGASKGLNYQANAELFWNNGGGYYDAYMKVSALFIGSRTMTSSGQITGTGLAPARFGDKFRNELAAHFLPDQRKIVFSANTPDAPWIEGAQDRVSVFLQLGGILAARPGDFPPGSEVTFYTVGPRETDTWTFVVEGQETLTVLDAEMPTVKVIRKPRREFDQKVEIWYAPSLGYLPVRNRITQQNGDYIDQQLSRMSRP